MPATVVDASIVAALVFEEPRASEAEGLIGGRDLHVPSLFGYELANIGRTKERRGELSREVVIGALRRAFMLDLHWHDVLPLPVFELASETDLTAYDAAYLHLAMALDMPIATFDQEIRAAPSVGQ